MKLKTLNLAVLGLLLMSNKCGTEDADTLIRCDLKNLVKTATQASGTIWFDSQAQAYAIFSGIDGTYDSQDIGVVCNLPDNYKKEGTKVVFNGKYFENKSLTPQIPGQEYYNLELTKISLTRDK